MTTDTHPAASSDIARLERRLKREVAARHEAEAIAERGLRDLFQRQQEIALLESIAVAANEAKCVNDAMVRALEAVCRYMHWPLGHLWLIGERRQERCFESTKIWFDIVARDPGCPIQHLRAVTEASEFALGTGLPGQVVASAAPVWIDVAGTTKAILLRLDEIVRAGFASLFAFPVMIGSEVVAVLEFFSVERQQPNESLLRLMAQIGTQLGRVIERRRAQDQLVHDALHDPLTQLGNRKLFLDRLQRLLLRALDGPDNDFAVLFVDLDRFKSINDGLGHQSGDQLIISAARRLSDCLREADTIARDPALADERLVARLGGDEFVILLDSIGSAERAVMVAERIMATLAEPFEVAGQRVFVTASVGIALSATGYADVEDILRDADIAMYQAKKSGRARWVIFDRAMQLAALRRLQMEADLRDALAQSQLVLHYQPIVSLHADRISGFEALLRWQHPVRGLVPPNEFIPVAEEIGLIGQIGAWVLAQACRQLREWQHRFDMRLDMSVNVSAVQFNGDELAATVRQVLRDTGIAPSTLKLELTESAVMADAEHALVVLAHLKALGVRISLDDFGTGYSSLSYLRRLPIDTLKIDRSFVSQLDRLDDKRQIVEVVLMLAHALGLDVVAEGVETDAEQRLLRDMGSDFVQGYFYYKPLTSDAAALALAAQGDLLAVAGAHAIG